MDEVDGTEDEAKVADEAFVVSVEEDLRLDLEADLRIEGVRSDSRAFGSSSLVYLPIEGRWMT